MIEIAYTPSDIDPKEMTTGEAKGLLAHQVREYISCKSWNEAERIVKRLIKQGHYDIFIDKYDRNNDLIDCKGFNQKT